MLLFLSVQNRCFAAWCSGALSSLKNTLFSFFKLSMASKYVCFRLCLLKSQLYLIPGSLFLKFCKFSYMSVSVSVSSKVDLSQYLALFPSKRLEESRDVCLCFRLSKDEFLQHMSWELSGQHFSISEFCSSFLSQNISQSFFQKRVQFDWCLCLSKNSLRIRRCPERILAKIEPPKFSCWNSAALTFSHNLPAVLLFKMESRAINFSVSPKTQYRSTLWCESVLAKITQYWTSGTLSLSWST